MPRISIVIPTYLNAYGPHNIRECLKSIVKHTDLSDVEIIVVANGAPPSIRILDQLFPCRLLWFDEALGYTRATNEGIKVSTGEFIVLLNDDCAVLGSNWLDLLIAPFIDGTPYVDAAKVGITGPMMEHDPNSGSKFLIFFCVMIRRALFDEIGLLDESFNPGFGEDTAMCIEARKAGWEVLQVPNDNHHLAQRDDWESVPEHKRQFWVADFPIFHAGEETFEKLPNGDELLAKNRSILKERYGQKMNTGCPRCGGPLVDGTCVGAENKVNCDGLYLWRASVIDGWFGVDEMAVLAGWVKSLPVGSRVIEIGSWHGRSSRVIADNLPEGGQAWFCDTWVGSSGEPEMHGSAHLERGDHAHQWWWCNLHDHILAGRAVSIRMHSTSAAHTLKHLKTKFGLVFIDASHDYENVKADILAWSELLEEGGIICGHDYYPEGTEPLAWIGVRQAVQESFPDAQKVATSLWWSRIPKKPRVIGYQKIVTSATAG